MRKSRIEKRSVKISGCKTSVSLEPEFFEAAQEIAESRGLALARYIETLGSSQSTGNLSSAIRTAVLLHYIRLANLSGE
jgi:predicted DNA-binding ribbon-helix-helix protein